MATPLIRIPREQGGTMYAFASAANDLTRAYYNPDINFEYSKFALIDLPVVATPSGGSTNNFIEYNKIFEAGSGTQPPYTPDTNDNVNFAETFQNYALNLENYVITDDDFDVTLFQTDAEKIFFKYLSTLGGFRTRAANSQEEADTNSRYTEEDNSTLSGSEYNRVVKYLGNIDVSNDKSYGGDTYNEIFINVPSSVGYTPTILFKGSKYNTSATSYSPLTNFINGRDGQSHPEPNLSLDPLADAGGSYDIDVNNNTHVGIEWDASKYAKIVNDTKLNNLFEYSQRGGDFRFNAILVYYDIYSKSVPVNRATNLYGIIILDNWKPDTGGTGSYIPELTKNKPNDVTGLNGNSYALKLNIKFNSSLDNVGIETNINDYSTFSMDLFFDTTTSLERAVTLLQSANDRYNMIVDRLDLMETLILTSPDILNLSTKMTELELLVENAKLNLTDPTSIFDMISSTNNRINKLISGEIEASVQVNTDVIIANANSGIVVDRSTYNDKIAIKTVNDGYNLGLIFNYTQSTDTLGSEITPNNVFNVSNAVTTSVWSVLKPFSNIIRLHTSTDSDFSGDLNIYIDDSRVEWTRGQVIKLSLKNDLNIAGNNIKMLTDTVNGYSVKVSIPSSDLLSNRPYIEIICIDEINKTFEIDVIR